jgi:hypothetical protein
MGFLIVTTSAQLDTADMAQIPDGPEITKFLDKVRAGAPKAYHYRDFYDIPHRAAVYLASNGKFMQYFAAWRVTPEQADKITAALGLSLSARWSPPEFYERVESAMGEKADNVQPLG